MHHNLTKYMAFLCTIVLVLTILSACGTQLGGAVTAELENTEYPDEEYYDLDEEGVEPQIWEDEMLETEPPTANYTVYHKSGSGLTVGYYEGLCWTDLVDETYNGYNSYMAVINEDGQVLYKTDRDTLKARFGYDDMSAANVEYHTTRFENGFSVLYVRGNFAEEHEDFIVIDSEGNELFTTEDGDDATHYTYMTRNSDVLIVKYNAADFSANTTTYLVMDPYGNVQYDIPIALSHYAGEGIFTGSNGANVFNINTGNYFSMIENNQGIYSGLSLVTNFSDGYAVVEVEKPSQWQNPDYYSVITAADLASSDTATAFCENNTLELPATEYFGEGLYARDFSAVLDYNTPRNVYYDLAGEVAVTVPVPEEGYIKDQTEFQNGYAAVQIYGADGNDYVTVVDRNGEYLYEPILGAGISYFYNGYVFTSFEDQDGLRVITLDGSILVPGVDDLSELGSDASIYPVLSGGYFNAYYLDQDYFGLSYESRGELTGSYGNCLFVSLDGKTIISDAYEYITD